jgi:uroporphyrinogen-III decarboxylase
VTTSKELVKKAIRFQGPERTPLLYPYDWRQSDIVSVDVVRNFLGPNKTLSEWGFEWQHLENDLTMGQPRESLIKKWSDLDDYRAPDPHHPSRFDAMRKMRAELGDDKYYRANFVLSGFTVMSFLRGYSETLEDMYLERENIERLADIVFGFEEEVIKLLKPQGFDTVGLADDWGNQKSMFISPKLWREIFKPRYKRQIALAHECGLDVYFHCCGYIFDIIPDLIEIGLDVLNPGQPVVNGIARMGEAFSGKLCFSCPVSYQTTGISGTKEEIYAEVKQFVDCLGNRGGGLIGIVPTDIVGLGAKPENIGYMRDAFQSSQKTDAPGIVA